MTKFVTDIGSIEINKTKSGVMVISTTNTHEVGISIPNNRIFAFIDRWFFENKNESIEVNIKSNKIVITITTNFKTIQHTTIKISRDKWNEIESEIRRIHETINSN